MKIEFYSIWEHVSPEAIGDSTAVVIDVLRATSVIATALSNGASSVIPVTSIDDALSTAENLQGTRNLLCGERKGLPIEGFDLGNSPALYLPGVVENAHIILTTMNGTRALHAGVSARRVITASFLNISAVADYLLEMNEDCAIICSGMNGLFTAEDALCGAGLIDGILAKKAEVQLGDLGRIMHWWFRQWSGDIYSAVERFSYGFSYLDSIGFREDIRFCLQQNIFDIVPTMKNGRVMAHP